jgi:glutamate synthase domain-containing protein 1
VWRDVPRDSSSLGSMARDTEPVIRQVFVQPKETQGLTKQEIALKMFILRKVKFFALKGQQSHEILMANRGKKMCSGK